MALPEKSSLKKSNIECLLKKGPTNTKKKNGEFLTQHLCNAGEAEFTTLLFWTFGGYKE